MKETHLTIATINNKKYTWNVFNLWNLVSEMRAEEVSLEEFNLDIDIWFREYQRATVLNVVKHSKRMLNADLDFPIIIAPNGIVLDGMHRIGKALILGHSTIKAVRLQEFPLPDLVEDCY